MAGAVDSLINWLRRDPWREPFEALMDDHIGEACEAIGGSDEDLESVIGAGNLVADYLKRRGFRETALYRAPNERNDECQMPK